MNARVASKVLFKNKALKDVTYVVITGFALFAMFFGAGNMVFPLFLGANAGEHILTVSMLFLIIGVGTPLLGLVATGLYNGNYWDFFSQLGKVPAFLIITFLMLIIGPLSAAPRTEVITYQSLLPFLPTPLNNSLFFSLLFCVATFFCAYRETKIIHIIGLRITPIKLVCFISLIVASILLVHQHPTSNPAAQGIRMTSISMAYGTMDMLGAFFFSGIAVRALKKHFEQDESVGQKKLQQYLMSSYMVGGVLLGLIYMGFMISAYYQSGALQNHTPDVLLHAIANTVMGQYGAIFVGICVLFACLATSIALADVTSTYLHQQVFRGKVSRLPCMVIVIFLMFVMTQLGFSGIMKFSYPILQIIYPALIMLCFVTVMNKLFGFKWIKTPVYGICVITALIRILH